MKRTAETVKGYEDNVVDTATAATVSVSLQLTATDSEQALMASCRQPVPIAIEQVILLTSLSSKVCMEQRCVKIRSVQGLETLGMLMTISLIRSESMTDAYVGSLTDTFVCRQRQFHLVFNAVRHDTFSANSFAIEVEDTCEQGCIDFAINSTATLVES